MRRVTVLIIAGIFCAAAGEAAAQGRSDYGQLYEKLWSTVAENFYDPHFRGTDWAGVRERYRERAGAVEDDEQFRTLAAEMLAEIRSSHLHIRAPEPSTPGSGIGATTIEIGGAHVVSGTAPLSDARRQGLRAGDRLLSPLTSLRGAVGSTAVLDVERCSGERVRLQVRREQASWPPERPGFTWSKIRTGPEMQIGYLRINRFDDGAAELADAAMAELASTQALVIDVRDNSGGNVSALRLASYFGRGAEPAVVLLSRQYLDGLGRPLRASDVAAAPRVSGAYTDSAVFAAVTSHRGGTAFWTDDVPRRYEGSVFVLIGEETSSAAEGFAWYMRRHTDAVLVGRPTAGALLSSERFPIGDGWSVTIPVHGVWGADGEDYGDRSVPPHHEVGLTREALCDGQDVDLARAISLAMGG
jgi:carboxyl-terminal processing protease